jgi:hypothetical protein
LLYAAESLCQIRFAKSKVGPVFDDRLFPSVRKMEPDFQECGGTRHDWKAAKAEAAVLQ